MEQICSLLERQRGRKSRSKEWQFSGSVSHSFVSFFHIVGRKNRPETVTQAHDVRHGIKISKPAQEKQLLSIKCECTSPRLFFFFPSSIFTPTYLPLFPFHRNGLLIRQNKTNPKSHLSPFIFPPCLKEICRAWLWDLFYFSGVCWRVKLSREIRCPNKYRRGKKKGKRTAVT